MEAIRAALTTNFIATSETLLKNERKVIPIKPKLDSSCVCVNGKPGNVQYMHAG